MAEAEAEAKIKEPTCVIVLGMAGSGKTTWVQRITSHLYSQKRNPYVINLDPACYEVPYPANIDIRDTVKYKEVMKQYSLGPNGGIMTSLNLFATKFDEVVKLVQSHSSEHEYIILDTPGQIEVFTWSASGSIISETLASVFPTVVVYVMDIVRSESPVTFMSNMLYACSILYKCKLPFVIALNKVDMTDHSFAIEWMQDFECFQTAIQKETTYAANLAQSMSLVLEEFYVDLKAVPVSAVTGRGVPEFFSAIDIAADEYRKEYRPQYERLKAEKEAAEAANQDQQKKKLQKDLPIRDRVRKMMFEEKMNRKGRNVYIDPNQKEGGDSSSGESDAEEQKMEEEEDDEEEKKEYEAFKKEFLSK